MANYGSGSANANNYDQLQGQVDQVKGVMKNNIDKIIERGDRLDDLADRTDQLENSAIQFNVKATRIKRKMWWKNTKMMLILAAVVITIILILGVSLYFKFSGGGGGGDRPNPPTPPPSPNPTTKAPAEAAVDAVKATGQHVASRLLNAIQSQSQS